MGGADLLHPGVALVLAYVAGSIPAAFLAGKWRGVDLRKHGSGNLGATNVVRVLGGRIGGAVFAVDVLKGLLPVYFLPPVTATSHPEMLALALGVAAIFGHVRSIFLLGRGGGKGVATATGVFLGLAWLPLVISTLAWVLVFVLTRYVSLASLIAAALLPIAFLATGSPVSDPVFLASVAIALFVFFTHRANIARLRAGTEHRFVRSAEAAAAAPAAANEHPPSAA